VQRSASFLLCAISQKNKTMKKNEKTVEQPVCTVQELLKLIAGKWKPEIFQRASLGPIRFSSLLRELEGSSKQSIALALREFEEAGILIKTTIQEKPLHIEYTLSEKGQQMVPIFKQLEALI